jgi:hypothetical protein
MSPSATALRALGCLTIFVLLPSGRPERLGRRAVEADGELAAWRRIAHSNLTAWSSGGFFPPQELCGHTPYE